MSSIVSSDDDKVTGEADSQTAREEFYELIMLAAELVDALGDQAARDRDNYQAGWNAAAEIFFQHGRDVGYAEAHNEMGSWWEGLAAKIRASAGSPSFAELQRRRAEPADAGYTGGPVEWEPEIAKVITLKRGVA